MRAFQNDQKFARIAVESHSLRFRLHTLVSVLCPSKLPASNIFALDADHADDASAEREHRDAEVDDQVAGERAGADEVHRAEDSALRAQELQHRPHGGAAQGTALFRPI